MLLLLVSGHLTETAARSPSTRSAAVPPLRVNSARTPHRDAAGVRQCAIGCTCAQLRGAAHGMRGRHQPAEVWHQLCVLASSLPRRAAASACRKDLSAPRGEESAGRHRGRHFRNSLPVRATRVVIATTNLMEESGTAAASLAPTNRGQFDPASKSLQNRSNTAVKASLLAAGVTVGLATVAAGGALAAAAVGRAAARAAEGVGRADGAAATAAPGGMPPTSQAPGGTIRRVTAPPDGRAIRGPRGGRGGSSSTDGAAHVLGATAAAAAASAASRASAFAAAFSGVGRAAPFAAGGGSSHGATGRGGANGRGRGRGRGRGGRGYFRGAATAGSFSSRCGGSAHGESVFPSVVDLMREQQTRSAAEADRHAQYLMETTASGSGSTRWTGSPGRSGGAGAAAAGFVPGTASASAKHLMWPPVRWEKFLAHHASESAYVSQLQARELALASLEQGVCSSPQTLYPQLDSQLISAAAGNFLFSASIICGAVSAVEFDERPCSTRINVDNSIVLVMLAQWMETFARD